MDQIFTEPTSGERRYEALNFRWPTCEGLTYVKPASVAPTSPVLIYQVRCSKGPI